MIKVIWMALPARFVVLLVLVFCCVDCHAVGDYHCEPSSCGDISNISYPFRLHDDPINCGDLRYNLSCENNLTVLYLYTVKYYVLAINYRHATIRVLDANIRKGNCSSLPQSSIQPDPYPYYSFVRLHGTKISNRKEFELSKPIIFMNCEIRPLNSSVYVETAPCINATRGNSLVITERLNASDLWDSCRIELMVLTSSWSINGTKDMNRSYIDIHNQLLYGFELTWCISGCYLNTDTNEIIWHGKYGLVDLLFEILFIILFYTVLPAVVLWTGIKVVFGIPCVIVVLILKFRRRHLSMYEVIEDFLQSHNNLSPIRYSYSNIKKMTKGFKDKLGEGGYGSVYKGKLQSGRLVAVKMLENSKANGQDFINEVATIGRIHHVNVVQLIGYCAKGSRRALVYDFMSNGSLDKHIFPKDGLVSISCKEAFEIALGVARGIDYLHQGCDMKILHFDIKPHNILLDENLVPKVSDFGLARLCPLDDNSLILTAARGTIGYIAPELFYKNIGGVSNKADMYSFGMLLMEIAGKRKNLNALAAHSSRIYFPSWVYDQFSEGKETEIEDVTDEKKKITKKMLMVALWCIQMKPSERPSSMNKVVGMLEGDVELIQMPPKPFLYPQDTPVLVDGEDSSGTTSFSSINRMQNPEAVM